MRLNAQRRSHLFLRAHLVPWPRLVPGRRPMGRCSRGVQTQQSLHDFGHAVRIGQGWKRLMAGIFDRPSSWIAGNSAATSVAFWGARLRMKLAESTRTLSLLWVALTPASKATTSGSNASVTGAA